MGEKNMTGRKAARRAAMAEVFVFIRSNPGCVAYEISKFTGLSHSEVSRYIRWKRMEWRPMHTLMDIRANNPPFYRRLLHDAVFEVRNGIDGMMINTSKREMFDRYCLNQGYNLAVNKYGKCFVYDFSVGSNALGSQKKLVLRIYEISSDDQKKSCEGSACQKRLM